MDRMQWKSTYRSARLGRRREAGPAVGPFDVDGDRLRAPGVRRRAAWAFVGLAMMAAALALWRAQPSAQSGEALAVSVPAASSPAADEGPSPVRS